VWVDDGQVGGGVRKPLAVAGFGVGKAMRRAQRSGRVEGAGPVGDDGSVPRTGGEQLDGVRSEAGREQDLDVVDEDHGGADRVNRVIEGTTNPARSNRLGSFDEGGSDRLPNRDHRPALLLMEVVERAADYLIRKVCDHDQL
jgi:hypothetical protein